MERNRNNRRGNGGGSRTPFAFYTTQAECVRSNGIIRSGSLFTGYTYSAICTGVTSALSVDTGLSRSATEFYNELIASGMSKPSEQYTFNTAEKLSLGWVQKFYKSDGSTVFYNANCVCEISASAFVNWVAC